MQPFKVICINDKPIKNSCGGLSINKFQPVKEGHIYVVLATVISKNNNLSYMLEGFTQPKQVVRFKRIDDQKERIRYVAVSETLREQAVEVAAIETN